MRNRFILLAMLMLMIGSSMNAQVIVARMQDLANAATNSDETKATPSTEWTTSVEGGAVYEFSDNKYLGGIVNDAVVEALEGDQYVTIAMWVYGRTASLQSVFGYGDSNNGLACELNSLKLKMTAKGTTGFSESGNFTATNMPEDNWYLVAYTLRGRASAATTDTYRYMNSTTNGQYYTKNDHKFHDKNAVGEESQKFAIGSSCQGEAAESFTGKIANVTVIRSSGLLNNPTVLSYLGAAPTAETESGFRYVTVNYTAGSNTFRRTLKVSGESFTVPTPDYYSDVTPSSFTNDGTTTSYDVTCTDNFPVESGKFYSMTIRKHTATENNTNLDYRSIYWDGSTTTISTRTASETAAGMGGYWRFERVPNTENKVRVYTNAKGKSQAINFTNHGNNQTGTLQSGAGGNVVFAVKPITVSGSTSYTGAFRLANPYVDNCNINDINGSLGVWVNDGSKTDAGSAIIATEVPIQPSEISAATYVDENNVSKDIPLASKQYYWDGSAEVTVDAPETYAFMNAVTATIGTDKVFKVNYTNNFPFVVSTDDAKYFQSLKVRNDATHYLTATYNSGSVTAGTTKARNNNISTDAVKQQVMQSGWAFVKEPGTFNKFRIYNEATGNLQLYLPNESNGTAATMAETGTAFVLDLQPSAFTTFTGGFTIRVNENDSHALGDHGSGPLAYWCNRPNGESELNDGGSIFRVADADVYVESVCTQMHNNSKAWVAKLNNQSTTSVAAFTTAATALEDLFLGASSETNIMQAYRKLAQAYYRVKYNLLTEAGADQKYRLRSTAFNDVKYMSVENTDMAGIKAIDLNNKVKKQLFTFLSRADEAEAGKFEIGNASGSKVIALSSWNVAMNANQGSGVPFTITYVGNDLYTITQSQYTNGGTYFAPGELSTEGIATVFNNQPVTCGRIHWVLEPVSNAELHFIENCEALSAAIAAAAPYENFYDADKAGLPGYLSEANQSIAESVNNYINTGRQQLEYATETTADYIFTGAIASINDNVALLKASLANFPTSRYFSINNTNGLGYLTYQPDASKADDGTEYLWTTAMASATAFDAGNTNHLWCFLAHEKAGGDTEYYLYNAGKQKFARPTKEYGEYDYTWIFSDEPAAITFHHLDGHKMMFSAQSAEVEIDKNVYASVSTGYTGPVISYYAVGDGGLPFSFDWGTVDFAASDTTAVAALVRTPITLRTVAKDTDPLITGLDDNQSICTYSSTKAFRVPEGVTAYYATRRDASNIVRLKAVPDGIVPANEGVLLVGAVNKTQAMLDVDYRTEATADVNIFHNTASGATAMGANCYVLANSTNGIGFYHATEGTTLSQGKAYLDFSGSSVRAFTLSFGDDDVTTGISSINVDGNAENAPVYDLSGRRIAEPLGRGIYIKNGKKYFVK